MTPSHLLGNAFVELSLDPANATYSITAAGSGEPLLTDARLGSPLSMPPAEVEVLREEAIDDELGTGKRVVLSVTDFDLHRHASNLGKKRHLPPKRLYSLALYDDHPALVLGFGVLTPTYYSLRLQTDWVCSGGQLFAGQTLEHPQTLNGGAGSETTTVETGLTRFATNSLLLTATVQGEQRSVVFGGLGQAAYGKFARLRDGIPELFAEDPIGVLVDEEQEYLAPDTFYLDLVSADPFEALERYGQALRAVNHARPQVYDFPVLCGWSVGAISKLPGVNTSSRLVEEADHANACGITKYTKVALRLEPDKYHFDTEQGWWDDEHFREFGHLTEPYDTLQSWCDALEQRGCFGYTYMQLGMPSDDFACEHPGYMLFNDASEIDRQSADAPEGKKHHHHLPFVTYDYTDEGFSKHFVNAWSHIRRAGVRGVKVDYPATAWRPEGGFDDRYASTNSAYRRAFELLRAGMGDDGLIDERNLGEGGRPRLDLTAGVVDTQRTWGDSNAFIPEMISRSGLRWYKNRVVFNYYSDTKAVHDLPLGVLQSLVTMNFLTSGRLDLATTFSFFTPEITHAVSRSYPHYAEAKTARPLDAFAGIADPQVYHLDLTPDWHQVTFYNTGWERCIISTSLSGDRIANALALDADARYHAYAFWTDQYLGEFSGGGGDRLAFELDANCCEMISLRRVVDHPQVISTDRHLLQGWVDLANVTWDADTRTLSGTAQTISDEPFTITIANNGYTPIGNIANVHVDRGMTRFVLNNTDGGEVAWSVAFSS